MDRYKWLEGKWLCLKVTEVGVRVRQGGAAGGSLILSL